MYALLLSSVNRCFDFTNKQYIHHATSVIVCRVVKWWNVRLRGYLDYVSRNLSLINPHLVAISSNGKVEVETV